MLGDDDNSVSMLCRLSSLAVNFRMLDNVTLAIKVYEGDLIARRGATSEHSHTILSEVIYDPI
jgi:hypothetical protein